MRLNKKVTIRDVAREAGVSTQTVSRVVNNRQDVSPETRIRVQKVIAELGYAPNVIARSLSQGRSNTLGVVAHGLEYFGSSNILTGIEHKANELGFSLLLSLVDQLEPTRVDQSLNGLLSHQVDGIIWAVHWQENIADWLAPKLKNITIPVVFLNKPQHDRDVIVAMDNYHGGKLATEHLLEQGYRRIGIITGPSDWWEAQERERGWRQTLQEYGTDDLEALRAVGDWWAASGDVGLHRLFASSPGIDAIFASNDQMALGALQAARRLGLEVPQNLGIVGFDDIPEAAYFYPNLTTVRQNLKALGALAVEQMNILVQARQHDGEYNPEISWIKPNLIIRQSSIKNHT